MFGTSGIRGAVGDEVTATTALEVGRALASGGANRVVVGRDPRESGRMLTRALVAGLTECGTDVVRLGEVPTPTVARGIDWYDADAGVVVTASHNPPADNGLKLWDESGAAYVGPRQDAVAERIESGEFDLAPWDGVGDASRADDAAERHVEALVEAGAPLDGLTVAVDPGNGSGRLTATALHRLGADVETLNAEPDGSFPARPSEPTAEHCRSLCLFTGSTDADLGIAHDGDADRMMAVTASGEFVPGDHLLALFGRDAVEPGERVAAPLNTSMTVRRALQDIGASLTLTAVGDGHVAERTADRSVAFGGEPSGAWIWPDEARCPDGPLAAVKLASMVAARGPLADQLSTIETTPLRRESVSVERNDEVVAEVVEAIRDRYDAVTDIDGVRVDLDDGWFLVRASGTQPLVRITAEAENADRTAELFERAREHVGEAVAALDAGPAGAPEA
ncbi:phosphoglucosamine mutase (plasmid) [Halorarum halophilum]|uniref:Phosphoglucosamine mutase n=1 Tax=Halorarum halophilum TaxID=2743090 RepID=A0A7D5GZS2_9EURY|nr:phosphoglucosamine mutase [Halobaculum halophilum]QLG29789.1 phosphoglucosamine mutase [Halobaculum halophilum]